MTKYCLDTYLTSKIHFDSIGKYLNKKTIELSHLEISQIIHTSIYGKHRRCTLEELFEYKNIILKLKEKYDKVIIKYLIRIILIQNMLLD